MEDTCKMKKTSQKRRCLRVTAAETLNATSELQNALNALRLENQHEHLLSSSDRETNHLPITFHNPKVHIKPCTTNPRTVCRKSTIPKTDVKCSGDKNYYCVQNRDGLSVTLKVNEKQNCPHNLTSKKKPETNPNTKFKVTNKKIRHEHKGK